MSPMPRMASPSASSSGLSASSAKWPVSPTSKDWRITGSPEPTGDRRLSPGRTKLPEEPQIPANSAYFSRIRDVQSI